jgi:hypothetical protein
MHDMSMDRVCFREHVYSQCTTIKERHQYYTDTAKNHLRICFPRPKDQETNIP